MCCRCTETVLSDILSRRAISLSDSPSAASSITSRSRAVSIRDILRTLNKLAKYGGEPTLLAGRKAVAVRGPPSAHRSRPAFPIHDNLYEMGGVRFSTGGQVSPHP